MNPVRREARLSEKTYDVLVAGAGPTGMMLAIDLGRRGIRTLLIERDADTKEWPKMDRSNARTMEIYRRMGLADHVRELGYPADATMDVFIVRKNLVTDPILHLKYPSVAKCREKIRQTNDGSEALEPYQLVSQNDLEPLLKRVAEQTANVTVRFGTELIDFRQDEDGVAVEIKTLAGESEAVRCQYLVGCDGGTSRVRKNLGIKLSGKGSIRAIKQLTFRSEELLDKIRMGQGRHYYFADEAGTSMIVQGSRKVFTFNAAFPDDADYRAEVVRRIGFDFDFEVQNVTPWKLHLLLADKYREGRVFIAGDAAHLVIPTGGLGMNTGVGDAMDLAWKLAGAVQGWGGPELLASYETERRSVGQRNVHASGWAAEGVGIWRAEVRPEIDEESPEGEACRRKVAEVADQFHRRVHEMVGAELGYSYAGSNLVAFEAGNAPDWSITEYVPTTRPGTRLPHMWLSDGRAIQDVLGADYQILDLAGSRDTSALDRAFADAGVPVQTFRSDQPELRKVYGASLLVLRPDLHVFWRGDDLPGNTAEFVAAATGHADRPFGAPRDGSVSLSSADDLVN